MSACDCNGVQEPEPDELATCASGKCPRRFLIIYGDPGTGSHNTGRLGEGAAKHHKKEIEKGTFPGVPTYDKEKDTIEVKHATDAAAFVNHIKTGRTLIYLAYFGHSWTNDDGKAGALYVGEEDAPKTNLGNYSGENTIPVTEIPKKHFYKGAQFRSFGCRSGYGTKGPAAQFKDHLGIDSYGYESKGGTMFTNDEKLGKGKRQPTSKDIKAKPTDSKPLWLIPINGSRKFKKF